VTHPQFSPLPQETPRDANGGDSGTPCAGGRARGAPSSIGDCCGDARRRAGRPPDELPRWPFDGSGTTRRRHPAAAPTRLTVANAGGGSSRIARKHAYSAASCRNPRQVLA